MLAPKTRADHIPLTIKDFWSRALVALGRHRRRGAAVVARGLDALHRHGIRLVAPLDLADVGHERVHVGLHVRVELLLRVGELAAQHVDARDLIRRRAAFPAVERAVEEVEMLADALLAGDRAAFGGRDDELLDRVELRERVAELLRRRILGGRLVFLVADGLARGSDALDELAHVADQRVRLHHRVEVRLAIGERVRRAAIEGDHELRRLDVGAAGEAHRVRARHDARALRAAERDLRGARNPRRLDAHVPHDAVDTGMLRRRDRVDDVALGVEYLELDRAVDVARAQVVLDHRALRRIVAGERRVAVGPAAARRPALLRRAAGKECGRMLQRRIRERTQWREIVDDPDAAAVRRDDQIALARVNLDLAHRDVGEVVTLELRERLAAVDRDPQAELGAEEQQIFLDRVFLDRVRVAANVIGAEARPGLAVVGRAIDTRRHVAERVAIDRRVRGRRLDARGLDPADPRILRQPGDVAAAVRPRLAAGARELQIPVVGAGPDHGGVFRRLADRVDRRVHLGGRVVDRDAARLLLLLLLGVVRRQMRRDALPGVAAVARPEQELRADVDRTHLRRRYGDRRVPVEAQLLVVAGLGLDVARCQRLAIDARHVSALALAIDCVRVGRIDVRPEAVAAA